MSGTIDHVSTCAKHSSQTPRRVLMVRCALLSLVALIGSCDKSEKRAAQRPDDQASSPARAATDEAATDEAGRAATSEGPPAAAPAKDAPGFADSAYPDGCPSLVQPLPTRVPAVERLVAMGDVHGDMDALKKALALAGAIDQSGAWTGGDLVIVQTGDILDRGDDERAIMDYLAGLRAQAREAGGDIHLLNGNHELMNAALDFRYVTPGGMAGFADVEPAPGQESLPDDMGRGVTAEARGRVNAFRPGGEYARRLAEQNVMVVVGDTVFVHGGVLAEHVAYGLDNINRDARCWLADATASPEAVPESAYSTESAVWTRRFSREPADCESLAAALEAAGAKRMVVGHTPQLMGITAGCDERVFRIDTGMAAHYGGPTQVLEIRGDQVRVLR